MPVSDYTGRTVDLLIAQGADTGGGMRLLTLGFGGPTGGQVTTGIQKASQTFLVMFMTEKGTRAHDPEFGTRFLTTARQSNVNDAIMQVAFKDAVDDILSQQALYRETDTPDDEILTDIELLSFATPSTDQLQLNVKLTTAAGTTRQVFVPVSLAIK